MARVFLSLGSNIGDKLEYLKKALILLGKAGVRVRKVSSVYQSAPADFLNQPDFLNIVVEVATKLRPEHLLKTIHQVEEQLDRKREIDKGPRTIDIDILLYNRDRISQPKLTIPHPKMKERSFVLIPLLEIAPRAKFPSGKLIGKSVKVSSLENAKIQKVGTLS